MSITGLIASGPLLFAMPVAAAAGAVTFLSPCCLPLVPGYLAYITGMSSADAADQPAAVTGVAYSPVATAVGGTGITTAPATLVAPTGPAGPASASRGRMTAGTALFVLGFSLVFSVIGFTVGGLGGLLRPYSAEITHVLGGVTVLLGLMFFGAFDRFMFAGRIIKPSVMPKAGLAGAPLLGVLFGIGWTPCIGPTLGAIEALSLSTGTAARGAFLAFVYGLGLGVPFLIVAALFQRTIGVLALFRRHASLVRRLGGLMLITLGLLEVTGGWSTLIAWAQTHWFESNIPVL